MKPVVAVVGGDPCTEEEAAFAEEVGSRIAGCDAVLVTGGHGGVMEAASRGARRQNGLVLAILPESDVSAANPWIDIAIPTGMGELRNGLIARCANVMVAVGGEHGTLSEIALGLKMGRPVIGWRTWRLETRDPSLPSIIAVATIDEAWSEVQQALTAGRLADRD